MPAWARNLVLVVGMLGWVAMIGVSLWIKQIPGAVLVGFPAGLWFALAGRSRINDDPSPAPGQVPPQVDQEETPR